jgi:hypothetical protein
MITFFAPVILDPELEPMTMLLEPAAPIPFEVPMKMFDDPPPPELPPMLIVFDTFDRPVEFEVPMRIELLILEILFVPESPPAFIPTIIVLYTALPEFPAR